MSGGEGFVHHQPLGHRSCGAGQAARHARQRCAPAAAIHLFRTGIDVNKTLSSAFHRSAIRGSKALLLSAAGPVALACAAPALADEGAAAPVAATATAETPVGEPILVTARRRDENVQKVPIAISVIGSEALAKTGNYTLSQVQQLVPSLQVYSFNPRNTNINIRGLGANVSLTNDGLENGVGFYLDNVYYGRPGQSQFDLVDLQQIEVLRGPQGTLFGKNTTAGAINITSKAPSFRPEAYGEASGGNYGYYQFRASVSAPIIADKAAFRLSLSDTHRDGYLTNIHDGSKAQDYDNVAIRGQLLIKPADAVSVKLIGDYANQRQNYVLNVPVAYVTNYDSGAVLANNIVQRAARANYTLLPATPLRGSAIQTAIIRPR
jgi:iron complex outermembrane receptor protein